MRRLAMVITVWLLMLLGACTGVKDNAAVPDASVIETARAWVMAMTDAQGIQALGLTCLDLRQAV
jgi:hypothetical protein